MFRQQYDRRRPPPSRPKRATIPPTNYKGISTHYVLLASYSLSNQNLRNLKNFIQSSNLRRENYKKMFNTLRQVKKYKNLGPFKNNVNNFTNRSRNNNNNNNNRYR